MSRDYAKKICTNKLPSIYDGLTFFYKSIETQLAKHNTYEVMGFTLLLVGPRNFAIETEALQKMRKANKLTGKSKLGVLVDAG